MRRPLRRPFANDSTGAAQAAPVSFPHAAAWLLCATACLGVAAPAAAAPARTPAELLSFMDSDGDGRVALHEYQHYLTQGFRHLDRNGDGVVSSEELPAGVSSRGGRRPVDLTARERALADTFRRQDGNADGYLDTIELAAPPR